MTRSIATGLAVMLALSAAAQGAPKLETAKQAAKGLAPKVAAVLAATGYRVTGDKGTVCEVWFVKSPAVKAKFKPTLNVKYPFASGQLLGALVVGKGQTCTDFRGQELKPGVYTLRYGRQPVDGNHIGTSETHDFLLALPAKIDTDPKPLRQLKKLHTTSAKSAGATHPAIFSLLPVEKGTRPGLSHDADKNLTILTATIDGKSGGKATKLTLRIVVIGKTAE
jgi:hypothetical protein